MRRHERERLGTLPVLVVLEILEICGAVGLAWPGPRCSHSSSDHADFCIQLGMWLSPPHL